MGEYLAYEDDLITNPLGYPHELVSIVLWIRECRSDTDPLVQQFADETGDILNTVPDYVKPWRLFSLVLAVRRLAHERGHDDTFRIDDADSLLHAVRGGMLE